jgi:Ca2+/H+ antiporter
MVLNCFIYCEYSMAYLLQEGSFVQVHAGSFERAVALIMEPLSLLTTVLDAVCWIIGGAFIFGAIGRYIQHWYNPSQSPLGQSIFLATLGCVLLLLPVVGHYALPGR